MKPEVSCPVLYVSSLEAAIEYYSGQLGFSTEFTHGDPQYYAGMKIGSAKVHLCQPNCCPERIGMGSVYFFCDEVDEFYKKLQREGVAIRRELTEGDHGMRNFQISDLDGNYLAFGARVGCSG